jgi:tetratricopeptide (TPR) repeat protein
MLPRSGTPTGSTTRRAPSCNNGSWSKARELYEKLEARYPFGRYAQQAQIEIAYCYYKEGETADAISTTDRFLKLNPNSPRADYVYYLRGLVNFIEPPKLIGPLIRYRVSERDPKALLESFEAFKELVSRYPKSPVLQRCAAAHQFFARCFGRPRGSGRRLLLPARRLPSGHQPGAGGAARLPGRAQDWSMPWASWCTATTDWVWRTCATAPSACCAQVFPEAPSSSEG